MAEQFHVVLCVKGAGRKEIPSPETYSQEDAENQIEAIRSVQRGEDGWLELPWITAKGEDVIVAFIQPAAQSGPGLEPEEILRGIASRLTGSAEQHGDDPGKS